MSETQNIEYKSSWADEYLKWICGFANSAGGTLFVGKDDRGDVVGISKAKRLMEEIPNKVRDMLGISVEVNIHKVPEGEFLEIIVKPSTVAVSFRGKYYFRSGNTNSELNGPALTNFLMGKTGTSWDEIILPDFTSDDLDPDALSYFRKNALKSGRMSFIEDDSDNTHLLQNLNLMKDDRFKRSAVLLYGKKPERFFPFAFAKIGRFGKSDSDLISQDVIEGNILQMPDRIIEILKNKYFVNPISYEGIHRKESLPYPIDAIREILINSVIHKEYSGSFIQISVYNDKITFWNPGKLPDELTFDDLSKKHTSHPHNPLLANIFFKAGLIEAWGRGTIKIIEECNKYGLPAPEFGTLTGGIYVTLFMDKFISSELEKLDLNERQFEALLFWKKSGVIYSSDYSEKFKITDRTARRDLSDLVDKKLLRKEGEKKSAKYLYIF